MNSQVSNQERGLIFLIQGYSIQDGPGIRTTVFMKGCPLTCPWCQNPESLNPYPELMTHDTQCIACEKCVDACPVEAMTLISANDPHKPKRKTASLEKDLCLGCGVCKGVCSKDGIKLNTRPERVITPLNGTHRVVMMAIERGKLQNLIFDNRVLWSHRALAAVLGVILKLPPVKQTLANKQVKSRYLESLIVKHAN